VKEKFRVREGDHSDRNNNADNTMSSTYKSRYMAVDHRRNMKSEVSEREATKPIMMAKAAKH
jgi:hypothetical protein